MPRGPAPKGPIGVEVTYPKEKPAPGSLEEQLETALKHNADIKFAEAKVREAEAELARTRQQVLGRVAALHMELQAHKESVKILQQAVDLRSAAAQGGGSMAEVTVAKSSVAKAQIELAKVEGELQLLVGSRDKLFSARLLSEQVYPANMDRVVVQLLADRVERLALVSELPVATVQQKMSDRLQKMLNQPIKIDVPMEGNVKDVLEQFWRLDDIGVPYRFLAPTIQNQQVQLIPGTLPIGAWLQMFEDSVPEIRFVVRDYGVLVTTKDRVPQGAQTVQDFWRRHRTPPTSPAETKDAKKP